MEPVRQQKIEEHDVADLDISNDKDIATELVSQVNQCEQYRKSPLTATFGFCRKIHC